MTKDHSRIRTIDGIIEKIECIASILDVTESLTQLSQKLTPYKKNNDKS